MKNIISWLFVRTTNENNKASEDLGNLWWEFIQKDLKSEFWENIVSPLVYVVYTNYEIDFKKWDYDVYIWFKVKEKTSDFPSILVEEEKFQIFEFDYNSVEDTAEAWKKIWAMTDLPRKYSFDLDEYDFENKKFKIYISLK